jgi:hypothetical protein
MNRLKNFKNKILGGLMMFIIISHSKVLGAGYGINVDSNGGALADSMFGKGVIKLIKDGIGILQKWILPPLCILIIVINVIKWIKADEHEKEKPKRAGFAAVIGLIIGETTTIILSVILSYFVE